MSLAERCRQCGAALPDLLGTLCPACVLELGDAGRTATDQGAREHLLGHLSILTLLGEGARARAYLAEWATPDGGFAVVKRLKPGVVYASARGAVLDRLFLLDHPNVAALLDAGLDTAGNPYTISEYVPGLPITRFCVRGRGSVRGRMELLLQAADALQYAHLLGIPHVNLKPSNLLVLPRHAPVLKVLDFEAAMPIMGTSPGSNEDLIALGLLLLDLLNGPPEPATGRLSDVGRLACSGSGDGYDSLGAFAADVRFALGMPAVQ